MKGDIKGEEMIEYIFQCRERECKKHKKGGIMQIKIIMPVSGIVFLLLAKNTMQTKKISAMTEL